MFCEMVEVLAQPHAAIADQQTRVMHSGEMWNSNSIIAWILMQNGIDAAEVGCPAGGRGPGWRAGVVVADREPAIVDSGRARTRCRGVHGLT
jgi:hypothetical protein